MTYTLRSIIWIVLCLLFILLPLVALLAGSLPPARDFWTKFSAALGYSGLAIMGLQFGITARIRYVTEPWDEDVMYHFHRQISLLAVALVVVHPLIMFVIHPELLALPQYGAVPWGAVFAFLSVFALLTLVVTALWPFSSRPRRFSSRLTPTRHRSAGYRGRSSTPSTATCCSHRAAGRCLLAGSRSLPSWRRNWRRSSRARS